MLKVQKNIPLEKYTTFRIGGPAKFFVNVDSRREILKALDFAKNRKLKFFILGGGSNILISDKGFDGLVIKIQNSKFKIQNTSVECDAGVTLSKIVKESINYNLTELEWAAGIPGTVGGAIQGNAGAFGSEIKDIIEKISVLDAEKLKIMDYKLSDCEFGYRESIFKRKHNLIILSAVFKLRNGNRKESEKFFKEIIARRIAKQPKGASAGSFFVNPFIDNEELKKEFEKETGKKSKKGKIPAGWLIDQLDLCGKKVGGAIIAKEHGNWIINSGRAKAEDVIILVSIIKQKVRNKFGVELQEEVQYIGFN